MGKPRRQLVIIQQWAIPSSRATPGKIITGRDALQNPQMVPPAFPPELEMGLTNTISLKDIKSEKNRKKEEDEDIANRTKRDSQAMSSRRGDS